MHFKSLSLQSVMLPLLNMGMRGLTLVGRFGLALYLAKYLSLADVGLFGLVMGVTNMMPVIAGWGLNYYVGREVVGKSKQASGQMVRDRLVVTFLSLIALVVPATPLVLYWHLLPDVSLALLALAIIVLECVAYDLHDALISMGYALAANVMLFVRSALWIFPVAVCGMVVPELRSLHLVFVLWLVGLVTNFVVMFWVLRDWPLRAIMAARIDKVWTFSTIRKGWLVYLSDLGFLGTLYLDRYVVNHFLGLSLTGIFTLYWSVANAVHALVNTGDIQLVYPALVAAYNGGNQEEMRRLVRQTLFRVGALSVALSVVAGVCFPFVLGLIGKEDIAAYAPVFWVMLAGVCVRLVAEMFNIDLACRHLDRPWAVINMVSVFLSFGVSIFCIKTWGLMGAGVAAIVTYSVLILARQWVLATAKPSPLQAGDVVLSSVEEREEV